MISGVQKDGKEFVRSATSKVASCLKYQAIRNFSTRKKQTARLPSFDSTALPSLETTKTASPTELFQA